MGMRDGYICRAWLITRFAQEGVLYGVSMYLEV